MDETGIKITRVKRESFFEMKKEHYHSYYEFYYLLSGSRKFFLNNKVYHVKSGDMMIIQKGEIHRTTYYAEGIHERIAFCFDDRVVSRISSQVGENVFKECFHKCQITIPINRRIFIEDLFERLLLEKHMQESGGGDELSGALCERYCDEILFFIIRCQRHLKSEAAQTEIMERGLQDNIQDTEIESAALYMSNHFSENITLKKMAELSCMSESYFSKRFKQVTGFGFKEYLNEVRIRHACDLLLSTEKNITQIALECGFTDSNYFGDAFRKKKSISPRQYRKANMV